MLFIQTDTAQKLITSASPCPMNFQQFKDMIKNETGHIYLKLIVDVAAEIENKAPCFSIAVYGYNEAKQIALAIMKSGLKGDIKKQNTAIVTKRRKELGL
ncbi:hypothetical protein G6F70_008611 [Rhizopus microsporus]|nr:hypothetical protein G6F71_008442 [Rhizopus microsporus]KAG1194949.1 hypothetical protein G6F70_008611 [Rhizopus microsporus]KAG1206802.1 hypothetical protein G6F69_008555 [Rhizopus microsporus]KAG1227328.1 hypothetical protein G6F67_008518 [Rhizopus microsporus]KAG1259073.1 hypothetical protein G6F68_008361 [Rhizopus microsporus]